MFSGYTKPTPNDTPKFNRYNYLEQAEFELRLRRADLTKEEARTAWHNRKSYSDCFSPDMIYDLYMDGHFEEKP
jgi:hypothetical protein